MISKCFQGDEYLCLYSDLSYRHVYLIYALIFHKTIRSPRLHLHDCIFLNLHHQLNNSCLEGMLRFAELFEFDTILRRTPRACLLPFSKRLQALQIYFICKKWTLFRYLYLISFILHRNLLLKSWFFTVFSKMCTPGTPHETKILL